MQNDRNNAHDQPPAELLQKILDAIRGIKFGSVEIVIHAGRVVQIERKEKLRLPA